MQLSAGVPLLKQISSTANDDLVERSEVAVVQARGVVPVVQRFFRTFVSGSPVCRQAAASW
jgi:hypothetical protein